MLCTLIILLLPLAQKWLASIIDSRVIEYCNIVWDPHQKFLQDRLRSVEKFGLKVSLKCWDRFISYSDLISMADLTPLETRRMKAKYILVYKVLYKLAYLPDHLFVVNSARKSHRTNHSLSPSCSAKVYLLSAIPHMIHIWNSLHFNPASCSSISHFKLVLKNSLSLMYLH